MNVQDINHGENMGSWEEKKTIDHLNKNIISNEN
jgi:hypothetical protein